MITSLIVALLNNQCLVITLLRMFLGSPLSKSPCCPWGALARQTRQKWDWRGSKEREREWGRERRREVWRREEKWLGGGVEVCCWIEQTQEKREASVLVWCWTRPVGPVLVDNGGTLPPPQKKKPSVLKCAAKRREEKWKQEIQREWACLFY